MTDDKGWPIPQHGSGPTKVGDASDWTEGREIAHSSADSLARSQDATAKRSARVMTDVESVARSLSEAQRRVVLTLSDNWASRAHAERIVWLPVEILETAAPLRSGHERVRLTPLGLAVRAHLLSGEAS